MSGTHVGHTIYAVLMSELYVASTDLGPNQVCGTDVGHTPTTRCFPVLMLVPLPGDDRSQPYLGLLLP
eukprot:1667751-Rhodomonas_salina.4